MSVKVSIIVPVYNCEKYLDEAIESLLNQTLKSCEFIFVNDGSKDKSLDIIRKYEKIDCRIKIINQKNQGVSAARNSGIKIATGEYIGFIDGDDYIDSNMYETLYNTAISNNVDVVISNFEEELEGKKIVNKLNLEYEEKIYRNKIIKNILPQFIENESLNTVCNKLFKREIISDNKILFPKDINLGEDGAFNIRIFCEVESLIYINYTGYHYREVLGSATRDILKKDYFNRALEVYRSDIPEFYNKYFTNEYLNELKANKFISNIISYVHIYFNPKQEVPLIKRYGYVRNMINNEEVNSLINKYFDNTYYQKGAYEKLLLRFIKYKFTIGIYLITTYSRMRCR